MNARRVLTLSPVLPYQNPNNAGARLVQHIQDALRESGTELLSVVPAGDATDQARAAGTAPHHLTVDGSRYMGGTLRQKLRRWAFPVAHPAGFGLQILLRRDLRNAVRRADIIDIQWEHFATLLPLVTLLNRRAHTVLTFHDVMSQKFDREKASATTVSSRLRWSWASWQARAVERLVTPRVDAAVVLSTKDRQLLPGGHVHVLLPPLAADAPELPRAAEKDRLLFVAAMYREENRDGLRWFLDEMWPRVKSRRPHALLDVAGAGAGEDLEHMVEGIPGVNLLGFVEDLEPLYAKASSVVVPLRRGAGVKFKVVDALVRGVPVVTTAVGAEGIGDPTWFAGVYDDPEDLADAVVTTLEFPGRSEQRASVVRPRAQKFYGWRDFSATVRQAYGLNCQEGR